MIHFGKGTLIRDKKTGDVYELFENIGAGQYGLIYSVIRVTRESRSRLSQRKRYVEPVADRDWVVKIGYIKPEDAAKPANERAKVLEDLRERYDREYKNLTQILYHSGQRFVPRVHQAELLDNIGRQNDGLPALMLQRMQKEWRLAQQIKKTRHHIQDTWLAIETLAVDAGLQYIELLEVLHKKVERTCQDRKTGDLFWDNEQNRLYVLDWNVVHDWNEMNEQSDIRVFGALWHELLVGNRPDALTLKDIDDPSRRPRWGLLTRGMRRLLVKTWKYGDSLEGFDSREKMTNAWRLYGRWLTADIQTLYQEGQSLIEEADKNIEIWSENREKVSDLLHLMRRRWPDDARVRTIETKYRDVLDDPDKHFRSNLDKLRNEFVEGVYNWVRRTSRTFLENEQLSPENRIAAAHWLLAARWSSRLKVPRHDNELNVWLRLLSAIEKSDWARAEKALFELRSSRKQTATSSQHIELDILENEIKYVEKRDRIINGESLSTRIEACEETQKAWEELERHLNSLIAQDTEGNDPANGYLTKASAALYLQLVQQVRGSYPGYLCEQLGLQAAVVEEKRKKQDDLDQLAKYLAGAFRASSSLMRK